MFHKHCKKNPELIVDWKKMQKKMECIFHMQTQQKEKTIK